MQPSVLHQVAKLIKGAACNDLDKGWLERLSTCRSLSHVEQRSRAERCLDTACNHSNYPRWMAAELLRIVDTHPDHTYLHHLANSPRGLTNGLLSAVVESGDTLEQWSPMELSDSLNLNCAMLSEACSHGRAHSVYCTPLARAIAAAARKGSLAHVYQLVMWGASIGRPQEGPDPPRPFTTPLHVAACLRRNHAFYNILPFLEQHAEPEDLFTLDSNGCTYTDLLLRQEDLVICSLLCMTTNSQVLNIQVLACKSDISLPAFGQRSKRMMVCMMMEDQVHHKPACKLKEPHARCWLSQHHYVLTL